MQYKNIRETIFSYLNSTTRYCVKLGCVPCKLDKNENLIPIMYVEPLSSPLCFHCKGFLKNPESCFWGSRSCDFCDRKGHSTCLKKEVFFVLLENLCIHENGTKYREHSRCYKRHNVSYCEEHSNEIPSSLNKKKKTNSVIDIHLWEKIKEKMISRKKDVTSEQLEEYRLKYDSVYAKKKIEKEENKKIRKKNNGTAIVENQSHIDLSQESDNDSSFISNHKSRKIEKDV